MRDRAAVLGTLLPVLVDIMMDNPRRDWGKPFYPVVKKVIGREYPQFDTAAVICRVGLAVFAMNSQR